jgi:hypothetical protein
MIKGGIKRRKRGGIDDKRRGTDFWYSIWWTTSGEGDWHAGGA